MPWRLVDKVPFYVSIVEQQQKNYKPIVKNTNLKGICWYNAPAVAIAIVTTVKPIVTNEGRSEKKQQQEIFLLFLEQVLPVNALEMLGGVRVAYRFIRGDIRGGLRRLLQSVGC